MIIVHKSHKFGVVHGAVCCVVCYVEKDWPLAEKVCGTEDRTAYKELRKRASTGAKKATAEEHRARGRATDEEILAALREGLSLAQVTRKTGAGHARIRELQATIGGSITDGRRQRKRPSEDLAAIAEAYARGLTQREIAVAHKASLRVVARALAEHGVQVRPGAVKK